MAKYYVESGKVQVIVHADGVREAAAKMAAMSRHRFADTSIITTISQAGFELSEDTTVMITTQAFGQQPPPKPDPSTVAE